MVSIIRTDSTHTDFISLVQQLDTELAIRDGKDHAFYDQFNKISNIKYAVVAYENNIAVGCGAVKELEPGIMEVKRMYVPPAVRGIGIAGRILAELEQWSAELSATKCVLETGLKQKEAIALYKKRGYNIIPNYGQYKGVANSVCFEKIFDRLM